MAGLGVPVEELSSRHQLQHQRDLGGRLEDLLQLDLKGATGGVRMGWPCREEQRPPGVRGAPGQPAHFPPCLFICLNGSFFNCLQQP